MPKKGGLARKRGGGCFWGGGDTPMSTMIYLIWPQTDQDRDVIMNSIKTFAEAVVWSFSVKTVLRNFVKFTGKHLCQRLVFNNIAGLRPATLLKKRIWHRCFPVNFLKFLTPFFIEHLWWLLLRLDMSLWKTYIY